MTRSFLNIISYWVEDFSESLDRDPDFFGNCRARLQALWRGWNPKRKKEFFSEKVRGMGVEPMNPCGTGS